MDALIDYPFAWVLWLLPLYTNTAPPEVKQVPHEFFVENVCGGIECNVFGWYNDTGIIYVDEMLKSPELEEIIFHEAVHHQQYESGRFDTYSCEDSITREREAYAAQNRYRIEARVVRPKPMNNRIWCKKQKPPQ